MPGKAEGKRIGIIGLDTSHSVAFTKSLNASIQNPMYDGFKIVAAYPQGSKDIVSSTERIPGYTEDVKKLGVEIVGSIQELLSKVDFPALGLPAITVLTPFLIAFPYWKDFFSWSI